MKLERERPGAVPRRIEQNTDRVMIERRSRETVLRGSGLVEPFICSGSWVYIVIGDVLDWEFNMTIRARGAKMVRILLGWEPNPVEHGAHWLLVCSRIMQETRGVVY
jgi:hypothetical protein